MEFVNRGYTQEDLNNITTPGYYYCNSETNSPFDGWKCVIVLRTQNVSVQIAISLESTIVGKMAVRAQIAGTSTWGSWKNVSFT